MQNKKSVLIRIPLDLYTHIEKLAETEYMTVTGVIIHILATEITKRNVGEFILKKSLDSKKEN